MALLTGNKGEWSEIYAFLRLFAAGKVYAADEQLNRIESMFFPIIKIIREEICGTRYEYHTGEMIKISLDGTVVLELPADVVAGEADCIYREIVTQCSKNGSFIVEDTETFMRRIYINKLKAPSTDKSDISMQTHDVNTGYEQVVGFSIKSELGSSPTLLNAGKTTNFIYRVDGLSEEMITLINAVDTSTKILDRVSAIIKNGGTFAFVKPENNTFADNLMMIDSLMAVIIAEMLVVYYTGKAKTCTELLDHIVAINPLSRPAKFYEHNLKELLCAVALGLKPATPWDGSDEATGGYIVVKADGEVLAYNLYNRDSFKGYLLTGTRFESSGTTRHKYAKLYKEDGNMYIKLNLQIRFI